MGPALPAEMLKPPYAPHVSGRVALFFGPFSGALVTVINLRRMGNPLKAKRIFLWTLLGTAILAVVLFLTPMFLARLVGLAAEIGFLMFYPPLQEREFNEWQETHPEMHRQMAGKHWFGHRLGLSCFSWSASW